MLTPAVLCMLWFTALGDDAPHDPAVLVERLGSSRFADREAASASLLELGGDAMQALRSARHLGDPEVQVRVESLIDGIERGQLRRPTNVTLNPQGEVTLGAVLRDIGKQTGFRFEIEPGNRPTWPTERIKFDNSENLPFWDALERLHIDGYWEIERDPMPFAQVAEPVLRLGRRKVGPPSAIEGPFRIVLRDVELQGVDGSPRLNTNASETGPARAELRFDLMAEPRLRIRSRGMPRILEASNSEGRSILPAAELGFLDFPPPDAPQTFEPSTPISAYLTLPDPPPRRISRLKCSIDIEIESRRLEPAAYPLLTQDDASTLNNSIWCGDVLLCAASVRPNPPSRSKKLELVLQPAGWNDSMLFRRQGRRQLDALRRQIEDVLAHVELADAEGRTLQHSGLRGLTFPPGGVSVESTVTTPKGHGPPSVLRYYGLVRDVVTLEFTLEDIALNRRD